jgi:hypothetical protein
MNRLIGISTYLKTNGKHGVTSIPITPRARCNPQVFSTCHHPVASISRQLDLNFITQKKPIMNKFTLLLATSLLFLSCGLSHKAQKEGAVIENESYYRDLYSDTWWPPRA